MREKGIRWALPGIVFVSSFAMSAACGSEAPDISGNDCPVQQDPSTTVTSTVATTGAGGTTSATTSTSTTVSTSVSTSVSTGTGMENPAESYDAPAADEIASRLHSCHKLTYVQLGNFLRSRGVAAPPGDVSDVKSTMVSVLGVTQTLAQVFGGSGNACEVMATPGVGSDGDPTCPSGEACFCNQDDKAAALNRNCIDVGNNPPGNEAADGYCVAKLPNAGYLYFTAKDALGVPKLDSRLAEKDEHSTASAMKLMDIFVQAAPQIIANIGDPTKAPACTIDGKNAPMFDPADGSCVEESVSCLLGTPATDDHLLLCNLIVQKAKPGDLADLAKKRNIAVAAVLSAAHSCQ